MGNAIVGPLGEGADVLGDPAGVEQAELLEHNTVVPREIARIGATGAVGIGRRELQHRGQRQPRRRPVALHRKPRALLFYVFD